ncbi:riboflavin biosynthesis protein RibF [Virgibacillus phasianinus]|uniref:Riboflavin biosynthesis protein n=1 Tax=Virgibacillus phasianinus TaxID=2017483 RepID=A0A220U6L5_9BACI|nr:bifunctional riboflavin kinase/FAD synthetase [Virgibacillus phasianinus]ASK63481.1 riboflavin biosynthesis protein RibF [Virgibacillus phasianinus]
MRTIELTYPHMLVLEELPKTVAAIGFFDGIHKGHQKVIQTAVTKAKESNMESAVITFHPHPSVVLKKEKIHVQYITPLREKQEILQKMNVDRLYIISFSKELASLSPERFIDHFIIGLNIQHLVAGFDFTYGHKGEGNMNNIESHTKNTFDYTTIEKVELENEKVSSTKIRNLLSEGKVEKVNENLNRPFSVFGTVVEGEKRGRTIGYPTANLLIDSDALLPKIGVYAVKVLYKGEVYEGMADLGLNPTFTDKNTKPILEVNIFDYSNDLYGEELQIEWHKYIRDEEKFDDVKTLIERIALDEKEIRDYFSC